MTESTSHVEQAVAARIAAAKRRTEDMRRQRAELAAARRAGLARRHARKLKNLTDAEQRAQQQLPGDDQDGDGQDELDVRHGSPGL
ncbi:hypothetical protein QBA35_28940 [Streptomyces bottropensis]|uniref:DUF4169 family protein n=1 Tax=Streptomyces bottropensis TaxID=42235 RepID=A0ABU8AUC8_9ACTN